MVPTSVLTMNGCHWMTDFSCNNFAGPFILQCLCCRNVDLSTCIAWQHRVKHKPVTYCERHSLTLDELTTRVLVWGSHCLKQRGCLYILITSTQCIAWC